MGAIGVSAFVFRDIIQYMLPTIIGAALFVPFCIPPGLTVKTETLLFFVVILAYIISAPIDYLASKVHARLPIHSLNLDPFKQRHLWWSENWNYDDLWVVLDKDEREYLSLSYSFLKFYQVNALYFTIYAVFNLGRILINPQLQEQLLARLDGASQPSTTPSLLASLLTVQTHMLGDWNISSLLLFLISLALAFFCYKETVRSYEEAFGDEGVLVGFATKYHREKGGVALRIWGLVCEEVHENGRRTASRMISRVTVKLYRRKPSLLGKGNDECLATVTTDEYGYFHLPNIYDQCLKHTCRIEVESGEWQGMREMLVDDKTVPAFKVIVKKKCS